MRRLVTLEIADDGLRPPWLAPGDAVRFWLNQPLREAPPGAEPLAHVVDAERRRPAIVRAGPGAAPLFDLLEAIRTITHEEYLRPRRPLHSRLPLPYQLVPGPLRLALFRLLVRRGRAPMDGGAGFPAWPADASVEALRFVADRLGLDTGRRIPGRAGPWPDGRGYAFAISWDVDTAAGRDRIGEIAALCSPIGAAATLFLVGDGYAHDHGRLAALRDAGCEIGLHGDRHDNRIAYLPPAAIERRLDRCRDFVERHEIAGFRAPSLLESAALRAALARRFRYASQIPDSEVDSLIALRRGCCSCLPFDKGGLLEVPITLPMDDKLLLAGLDADRVLAVWRRKLGWVRRIGGVAQLALHAEPHLLDRSRGPIRGILEDVAADGSAWVATLGEIARRWEEPLEHA